MVGDGLDIKPLVVMRIHGDLISSLLLVDVLRVIFLPILREIILVLILGKGVQSQLFIVSL